MRSPPGRSTSDGSRSSPARCGTSPTSCARSAAPLIITRSPTNRTATRSRPSASRSPAAARASSSSRGPANTTRGAWLDTLPERIDIEIRTVENNLFLTDRVDFADWFGRQRRPVMEAFYRRARIEHRLLMDGEAPARRRVEPRQAQPQARPSRASPAAGGADVSARRDHLGGDRGRRALLSRSSRHHRRLRVPGHSRRRRASRSTIFSPPACRASATMKTRCWPASRTLFHSQVSLLMNAGLLEPLACCRAVEDAYRHDRASLNAAEGYVRQIIGWREYVHGVYETLMPEVSRAQRARLESAAAALVLDGRDRPQLSSSFDRRGRRARLGTPHPTIDDHL